MSNRRLRWIGSILVLGLMGCGATEGPTLTASATPSPSPTVASALPSAPVPATSSVPSSTPEYTGITRGLILAGCMKLGEDEFIQAVQLNRAGNEVLRTSFAEPSDDATYHSNAECGSKDKRSAFNQDFTRLFVNREVSKTSTTPGEVGIGYLSAEPDGQFVPLTTTPDEFTAVKNGVPSYDTGGGRVYYCDNAKSPSKLVSTTIDGHDARDELELQALQLKGTCSDPIMAGTKKPVVKVAGKSTVYDETGTTSISVAEKTASPSFTVNKNGREKIYKLSVSDFNIRDLELVGFLNEGSVVFTDTQKIYVAALSGTVAKVTTPLDNTIEDIEITDVMISADKKDIAFITQQGELTKLYLLSVESGVRTGPTTLDNDDYRLVQFD
jgi:hypothetical protein